MTQMPLFDGDGQPEDDVPEPVFARVEDWVDQYFRPVFRRPVGGVYRWCPRWWAHAEAVTRLTALWRAWESCRLEPATGIADWLRDYLDPEMSALLSAQGPFYQCDPESGHTEPKEFPADPVDPGTFGVPS